MSTPKPQIEDFDFSLSLSKGLRACFVCECGAQCFEEETLDFADGRRHIGCGQRVTECPF